MPSEVSTWTAVRRDGSTYHDLSATYADLRADAELDALVLAWNGRCVVVKMPAGAKPFFLRRVRPLVSLMTGEQIGEPLQFASAIGWERDGVHSVVWLLHDGSSVLTTATDLDDVIR